MKMKGLPVGYIMTWDQLKYYSIYYEKSLHENLDKAMKDVVVAYFSIIAGIHLE
jgi:hypothetical protein